MLTNAGGGYSRRQQLALTRWREDITSDNWGSFVFVRDLDSGDVWSTTHQPSGREADEYEVDVLARPRRLPAPRRRPRNAHRGGRLARRRRRVAARVDHQSQPPRPQPRPDQLRRSRARARRRADLAHPAFSNLFVETTAVPERDALFCTRRPRSGTDRVYLFHVLSGRGRIGAATEYETDRARFIGRGRTLANPAAMASGATLSNTTGAVLDPIVSLRQSIRLPPGGTARLSFTTGFADNEATRAPPDREVLRPPGRGARHRARQHACADRAAPPRPHHRRHDALPAPRRPPALRRSATAGAEAVLANRRGQSELWKYGISGDLPIVLVYDRGRQSAAAAHRSAQGARVPARQRPRCSISSC